MNLTIEEAHVLEIQLERQLKKEKPGHPALKCYGSNREAIDAYYEALFGYKFFVSDSKEERENHKKKDK